MKVLIANTHDLKGGAARAASRLHLALLAAGANSRYHVQNPIARLPETAGPRGLVRSAFSGVRAAIDAWPLEVYRGRQDLPWSPAWLPGDLRARVHREQPDIVNLHWITGGFLSLSEIGRLHTPTVITLHDMWPLTGGCHYSGPCDRFRDACGKCPQLGSGSSTDLSHRRWRAKRDAWSRILPVIVSPSRWLAGKASDSSLTGELRIEVIPNAIDTTVYRPAEKAFARKALGLPDGARIVLFADDSRANPRKGFEFFREVLERLSRTETVHAAVFGRNSAPIDFYGPVPTHWLGRFADDLSLAVVYSAADVYVSGSSEEAFSLTIAEAMACGVPVVATDSGGPRDLVDEGITGFLTAAGDAEQMAESIRKALRDPVALGAAGRAKAVGTFERGIVARRYLALFEELIDASRSKR